MNAQRSVSVKHPATEQTVRLSTNGPDQGQMSEKARGKQPAAPVRSVAERPELPSRDSRMRLSQYEQTLNHRPRQAALQQVGSFSDLSSHNRRRESGASRSTFGVGSFDSSASNSTGISMARSQSHQKLHNNLRAPAHGLFTGATSGTSSIAAAGTIADQSGLGSSPASSMLDHMPAHHHSTPTESQQSSMFSSRTMTPTQPTNSASVPLGRTKSQLTLILEREKGRSGQKQRSKS